MDKRPETEIRPNEISPQIQEIQFPEKEEKKFPGPVIMNTPIPEIEEDNEDVDEEKPRYN